MVFFGSGVVVETLPAAMCLAFKRMNCSQYFMIFCGIREEEASCLLQLLFLVQYLLELRLT